MAIKNQTKRKQNTTEGISKRFSKAKMKREMVSENTVANKAEKTIVMSKEPRQYTCSAANKYQFKNTPKRIFTATLKQQSSQQKGYEVLNKGQLVTVEDFGSDQPLRIMSTDGRIGITQHDNVKSLFS